MTPLAPPFNSTVFFGMIALALVVPTLSAFRFLARPVRAIGYVALTLGVTGWLATATDVLIDPKVIPPAIFALTALGIGAVAYASRLRPKRWLRPDISIFSIIALQCFRFPLELLMWHATTQGIMPLSFSLKGYNFDVVTGVGALALAVALALTPPTRQHQWRPWVRLWNLWGIACLLVIAVLAILTTPRVHAFGASADKINSWVLFFPYVWLPTVLVPCAVLGHVLTTRWLRQNPRSP